ncbi:hypothetical protein BDP55DRAFT_646869 [Colletotrichum godetiae]|uniref:Secreted protein n=1 Tax=Colletotrichum godetiae TaxID=1209918 RepID=A0AAJ0AX07_9PEZI|nr:uncharacterized protein BDP55DRAFT_646869 [Colletotrichum godetiae]KAK1691388.1 hypothetical protein BDP55DRAFT_646869 [Colletotrichum godetiae]
MPCFLLLLLLLLTLPCLARSRLASSLLAPPSRLPGLSSTVFYGSALRTRTRDGFWTAFCDKRCWLVTRQGILSLASRTLSSLVLFLALSPLPQHYSLRGQALPVAGISPPLAVYVLCRLLGNPYHPDALSPGEPQTEGDRERGMMHGT